MSFRAKWRNLGLDLSSDAQDDGGDKMSTKEMQSLEAQRTKCEVYSRVVGYIRPVQQWNDGKQAEYADRKEFVVDNACGC